MRFFVLAALLSIGALTARPVFAETIHIGVEGLVCAFCVKGLETAFQKNDAVTAVQVDLEAKLITVQTKTDTTLDDAVIKRLVTDAGYSATTIHRQP